MKQYLKAEIQALSNSDISAMIDPMALSRIKAGDPTPEIRVYSIGHEGPANLNLPGIGQKTFQWIQAAVQWVGDKLNIGTAVFNRHDPTTNSHTGREKIGEVVGKTVKQIGDHLNALAAVYVYPAFKARPLDVASIEADIEYEHDGLQAWPTSVRNVSGIALSSSDIDNPGFPGATLLGAVQAYVQAFGGELGDKTMTVDEIKAAIREKGLVPTQLFDVDTIMKESAVETKVRERTKDHFLMAERTTKERDEARAKLAAAENARAEAEKVAARAQVQSKTSTVVDGIIAEKKLDGKAGTFVKRQLKNFTTEAVDEDGLKKDLSTFIDSAAGEYKELAESVFGVKEDASAGNPPGTPGIPDIFKVPEYKMSAEDIAPSAPSREQRLAAEMDPNLNPLIPGGKAAREALSAQ